MSTVPETPLERISVDMKEISERGWCMVQPADLALLVALASHAAPLEEINDRWVMGEEHETFSDHDAREFNAALAALMRGP